MRRLLLVVLLVACAWVFVRPSFSRGDARFDPLDPHGREVERAIEEGRYTDALPLAVDLQSRHPGDPTIAHWLAEIQGGLGHGGSVDGRLARDGAQGQAGVGGKGSAAQGQP